MRRLHRKDHVRQLTCYQCLVEEADSTLHSVVSKCSMGAGNLLLSGIKRKQPQALRAPVGGAAREAADVLPMDMILDSLKVPKLRHTQG